MARARFEVLEVQHLDRVSAHVSFVVRDHAYMKDISFAGVTQFATEAEASEKLADLKKRIKNARARANRKAHDDAMRSVGLVKTPHGWE